MTGISPLRWELEAEISRLKEERDKAVGLLRRLTTERHTFRGWHGTWNEIEDYLAALGKEGE